MMERQRFVSAPAAMTAPGTLEAVMAPISVRSEPRIPLSAPHVARSAIKAVALVETTLATAVPTATATVASAAVIAMLR